VIGSFLHGGEDGRMSLVQRGVLVLMLVPAALGAVALPMVVQQCLTPEDQTPPEYLRDVVTDTGTVLRRSIRDQGAMTETEMVATVVGLTPAPWSNHGYRTFDRYASTLPVGGDMRRRSYYYCTAHQDVVVYDQQSRRFLGYQTLEGISRVPDGSAIRLISIALLVIDDTLAAIDHDRLVVMQRLEPGERVLEASWLNGKRFRYIAVTTRALRVVEPNGHAVALPLRPGKYAEVGELADGRWIELFSNGYGSGPETLLTMDAQGRLLAEAQLPPLPPFPKHRLFIPISAALMPLAPAFPAILQRWDRFRQGWRSAESVEVRPVVEVGLALGILGSLVLVAWLARGRGLGPASTLRWLGVTVILNAAGPLLLLMVHPARDRCPCPGCGRLRAVEAAACPHCGAPAAPVDPAAIILRPSVMPLAVVAR
jgi:hypothetical protein